MLREFLSTISSSPATPDADRCVTDFSGPVHTGYPVNLRPGPAQERSAATRAFAREGAAPVDRDAVVAAPALAVLSTQRPSIRPFSSRL